MSHPRIAFNALFLDPGVSGGPETYLRELVPSLAHVRPEAELAVFTTRRGAASLRGAGWHEWVTVHELSGDEGERGRRLLAEQLLLPAKTQRFQLLHSLASVAPAFPRTASVVTLHDVTFMRMRTFGRATTLAMRLFVERAARRADALIAVSASARDDVAAWFGFPADRLTVVPHGPGRSSVQEPTPEADLRAKLALNDSRVVACVAAKRPHKNQELLVRAVPLLPPDVVVVLAGRPEPYDDYLRRYAQELGVEGRLRLPGYLDDADLEGLWSLAACAAFPTRAEGFGLPVLESMRRGVPVACSDIPVLREVGADVAHYFDPNDADAAAAALVAAMRDTRAPTAGRERAKGFTWKRAAERTWAVYDEVLSSRS